MYINKVSEVESFYLDIQEFSLWFWNLLCDLLPWIGLHYGSTIPLLRLIGAFVNCSEMLKWKHKTIKCIIIH